jgi:tetratricopeptide (TPR) repeat protein
MRFFFSIALVLLVSACSVKTEGRPEEKAQGLNPIDKPVFNPEKISPCSSHTDCYLKAKQAHASGERAGYLLALDRCEYYRGRFQLEKFYGLCLLLLGDAYRHLDNFEESSRCYQRFIDTSTDDSDLLIQARADLDEVEQGAAHPLAYRDYLKALSLLARYNLDKEIGHLRKAQNLLASLQSKPLDWALKPKVEFLLKQVQKHKQSDEALPVN